MKTSFKFLNEWVRPWREYVAECIGTFLLVFIASMLVYVERVYGNLGDLGIAIGLGFSYTALIFVTSPISSGFLNPALAISLWLVKKISGIRMVFYLIFQILGGFGAAGVVNLLVGSSSAGFSMSVLTLGLGVSYEGAMVIEAILTTGLVFALFATYVDRRGPVSFMPIVLGFYVTCASLIAIPLTGAILNPAKVIGPLLLSQANPSVAIYVIAPLFASLFGLVYEYIFMVHKKN